MLSVIIANMLLLSTKHSSKQFLNAVIAMFNNNLHIFLTKQYNIWNTFFSLPACVGYFHFILGILIISRDGLNQHHVTALGFLLTGFL